jgi:hypothetical protein
VEDHRRLRGLLGWDEKKAFESLERRFDPDTSRFIDETDHAGVRDDAEPPEQGHRTEPLERYSRRVIVGCRRTPTRSSSRETDGSAIGTSRNTYIYARLREP